MRDDFSQSLKRKLAERVAWRCSFPGCNNTTIGPSSENNEDSINLGEAAHIYAASENGPRFNPAMSQDERKSIENAIWLCRQHARLIDIDYTNYSASTLVQWKKIAENKAYNNLKDCNHELESLETLVSLGNGIIFTGIWKSVNGNNWTFRVGDFIVGSINDLKEFSVKPFDDFILVESQGDGRKLVNSFRWALVEDEYEIVVSVKDKALRIDPNTVGGDIALGKDGDLLIENGGFKMVSGIERAKQTVLLTLSTRPGDIRYAPMSGSFFSKYYELYRGNIALLNKMLKLELIRLISIPTEFNGNVKPDLNFINRVIDVEVRDLSLEKGMLPISFKLEWGNGSYWEGILNIFIRGKHS